MLSLFIYLFFTSSFDYSSPGVYSMLYIQSKFKVRIIYPLCFDKVTKWKDN